MCTASSLQRTPAHRFPHRGAGGHSPRVLRLPWPCWESTACRVVAVLRGSLSWQPVVAVLRGSLSTACRVVAILFEKRSTAYVCGTSLFLKIDQPMSNCSSHGTLLHFGRQNSRLNICYYHQDLRCEPFPPKRAPKASPQAPTTSYSLMRHTCNNGWVSVTRLSAIHFRG